MQTDDWLGLELRHLVALKAVADFHTEMEPYTKSLQGAAKKLDDLYPPPKSFWESAVGFLGDLAKAVAPALLNLIPGVGEYFALPALTKWTTDELVNIFRWLSNVFPPNEDPPLKLEAHFVGPEEEARRWRDSVLRWCFREGR